MVVIDGFWTGFITGVLVILALLFVIAFYSFTSEQRTKAKIVELLYKIKTEKGEMESESED